MRQKNEMANGTWALSLVVLLASVALTFGADDDDDQAKLDELFARSKSYFSPPIEESLSSGDLMKSLRGASSSAEVATILARAKDKAGTELVKGVTVAELLKLNTITYGECVTGQYSDRRRNMKKCDKFSGRKLRALKGFCMSCRAYTADLCVDFLKDAALEFSPLLERSEEPPVGGKQKLNR